MAELRTNVWAAPDRFVGRAAELERLGRLLAEGAPLVTLLGPPGAGKTRLARQLAETIVARDPPRGWDEVWFVDLSSALDADQVLSSSAAVLGVDLVGSAEAAARQLATALAPRGAVLVVLDNLEQVCEAVRPLLGMWLALAPNVRWLATSRHRLQMAGEHLVEVEPLPVPPDGTPAEGLAAFDSVALFLDRARAAGTHLALDGADAAHLVTLTQLLDGLPLALEMAAARLNLLDLGQMVGLLHHRLAALRDPSRPAERHATLRAAIEWSWDLLDEAARRALAQCAIFRGDFDLQAAQGVLDLAGTGTAAVDAVQTLRDKSLLQVRSSGAGRRLALLLSIRDLAEERLRQGEGWAPAARRHALTFGARAKSSVSALSGPGWASALARLQADRDNLWAAVDRFAGPSAEPAPTDAETARPLAEAVLWAAIGLDQLYAVQGPIDAIPSLLARALALADAHAVSPAVRARAAVLRGWRLRQLRRMEAAWTAFDAAEALLASQPDAALTALLRAQRALIHNARGQQDEALALSREAVAAAVQSGHLHTEALVRNAHGFLLRLLGLLEDSRTALLEALRAARQAGTRHTESVVCWMLANCAFQQGDLDGAATFAQQALSIAERAGYERLTGYPRGLLGVLAAEAMQPATAAASLDEAIDRLLRVGLSTSACFLLVHRAELARRLGDRDQASIFLQRALDFEGQRDRDVAHEIALHRAQRAWDEGGLAEAEGWLERAAESAGSVAGETYWVRLQQGALACIRGNRDTARARFADAQRIGPVRAPHLRRAGPLYEGQLDALALRQATDAGDGPTAAALAQQIARRLAAVLAPEGPGGRPAAADSWTLTQAAERLLAALPASYKTPIEAAARDPEGRALVVAGAGAWFRPPDGVPTDLSHRPQLARLLDALVGARLDEGARPLPPHETIERVWPGEAILPEAAQERLYYVVKALRKAGLGARLVSLPDGYALDPALEVIRLSA